MCNGHNGVGATHLSPELQASIANYLQWDPRPETRKEVQQLVASPTPNVKLLEDMFLKRLEFGTAGLRGGMGPGFNRMNDLTVIQATQGICLHILGKFGAKSCAERGVVLGFDGRHNSERYAHAAAAVFLSKGVKVFLNSKVTATPMNPFAIVKYGCLAGGQVTASHNPKEDNGYKIYADNGAQIIPPTDSEIAGLIQNNLKPWSEALALLDPVTGFLSDRSAVIDPYDDTFQSYMDIITRDLCVSKADTASSPLKIVYTAMHGVGFPYVSEILNRFGFDSKNVSYVEEQKLPDPEFSTVRFPNPEEKGAMNLAVALADRVGAPMVVANDPDSDRFACVEKQVDGTWKIFHGDELGILFGAEAYERHLASGLPKEKMLFICSAVSSRMLQKMAEIEGCRFEETMTGFKWMMNKARELAANEGYTPCLVYEEALGYALHPDVPDKDGVSALAVWVQMACKLYSKGMTVGQRLEELRKKYGYFVTNNSYFLCYDKEAITRLFNEFRNGGAYKRVLGPYKITRIRDVTTGYDDAQPDNKCQFPLTPTSQMVTLYFENGGVLTLRTSGTEPKLKWYAEMSGSNPDEARASLNDVVDATIKYLMQPDVYPLEKPKAK